MKSTYTSVNQKINSINYTFLFIIVMLLAMSAITSFSEITNAGFESWSNGDPDNWKTTNSPPTFINVTQSNESHSGSSAVKGEVISMSGFPIPCALLSGTGETGFSENTRPAALHGWYKFTSIGGDLFQVIVTFQKNGIAIGAGQFSTTVSTANYTEFIANTFWSNEDTPDTVHIAFEISGTSGQTHIGSNFIIDDLAWGAASASGVNNEATASGFSLQQNYPNPCNQTTSIEYMLPEASHVTLKVYDILGREISTLSNDYQSSGIYEYKFDASKLPEGSYFYRLQAGTVSLVRQMDVVK